VKVVDANLLVYAIDERSPHHPRAKAWLEDVLAGSETVGLAWFVLLAVIRLTTNARVFETPLAVDEAIDIVGSWLEQPPVTVVHPTDRHTALLRELLAPLGAAGNLVNDGHLAALSIEHGAELCSADADFGRFPRVRWVNPLAAAV
jgi:toxin-antitoxin system PIN domain toxin